MCGGRRPQNIEVKVPVPAPPPPLAPPPVAPTIPKPRQAPQENVELKKIEKVGVQSPSRERERVAIRQGTSSLRIPLNSGIGGTSGGLNV